MIGVKRCAKRQTSLSAQGVQGHRGAIQKESIRPVPLALRRSAHSVASRQVEAQRRLVCLQWVSMAAAAKDASEAGRVPRRLMERCESRAYQVIDCLGRINGVCHVRQTRC